jgi:hypothetical protein
MLSAIEVWLQKIVFGALGFKKPGRPTKNTVSRFGACFGGVFIVTAVGVILCALLLAPEYAHKFVEYLQVAYQSRTLSATLAVALVVWLIPVSIWSAIIALAASFSYPDQLTSVELMTQSIRVSFVLLGSIAFFVKGVLWLAGK